MALLQVCVVLTATSRINYNLVHLYSTHYEMILHVLVFFVCLVFVLTISLLLILVIRTDQKQKQTVSEPRFSVPSVYRWICQASLALYADRFLGGCIGSEADNFLIRHTLWHSHFCSERIESNYLSYEVNDNETFGKAHHLIMTVLYR